MEPKFREKQLLPLHEFFVAQRFNLLFYTANFMGWVALGFASLSYDTYETFPEVSQLTEWISREFIDYAEWCRNNMVRWTMLSKYEDIKGDIDGQ
jgi:hypothetical protein